MYFNLVMASGILILCIGLLVCYHWVAVAAIKAIVVSPIRIITHFEVVKLMPEEGGNGKRDILSRAVYLDKQGAKRSAHYFPIKIDNRFSSEEEAMLACAPYIGKEIVKVRAAPWIKYGSQLVSQEGRRHILGGIVSGVIIVLIGVAVMLLI